jgi:broad specificity phosphatase PhoE
MPDVLFVTHPDVAIDPNIPVPEWTLSDRGRERMRVFATTRVARAVRSVVSSTERKAIEGAELLAEGVGAAAPHVFKDLGENDRSATGYLPRTEFEATADRFFAFPEESVRGWERAADAQSRVVSVVRRILAESDLAAPIAIVAHGGVGTLLLCHLLGEPISRKNEQPGGAGGNYLRFERATWKLVHAWRPIEDADVPT